MPRESWEIWHDDYQEYYEDETPVYPDDIEEWKKEEQKILDELQQRLYAQYGGRGLLKEEISE